MDRLAIPTASLAAVSWPISGAYPRAVRRALACVTRATMMPLGYAEKARNRFPRERKKPLICGESLDAVDTVAVPNQVPIYEVAKIRRRRIAGLTLSNAARAGATENIFHSASAAHEAPTGAFRLEPKCRSRLCGC